MDEEFDPEEAKRELKGYLNERMRVRISDGRVVEGMFQCTDKHRNLVLANCEEYLTVEELGKESLIYLITSAMAPSPSCFWTSISSVLAKITHQRI